MCVYVCVSVCVSVGVCVCVCARDFMCRKFSASSDQRYSVGPLVRPFIGWLVPPSVHHAVDIFAKKSYLNPITAPVRN